MISKFKEKTIVFAAGAVGYGLCEIIWRGFTHWTMLILGGICFLYLYLSELKFSSLPLWLRCVSGGVIITSLELFTGSFVNILFKMNVWDYSQLRFNFLGQVCPQFFLMWILLCIPAFKLCSYINSSFRQKDRIH